MDRFRNFSLLNATLCLAMAGVFAVACDSGTQEPDAPDHSSSDEATNPQSDAQSQSGSPAESAEASRAAVPDEFPSEVPIYPGAVPSQGKGFVSEGVPMAAVQFQTKDTPQRVFDFYTDELSRAGWTIEKRDGFKGKNAIAATKGKCTATMLAAPSEDGGTDIFMVTEC